jgi:hypothetical protein
MTEVWQYAVPIVVALSSIFHLFIAEMFTSLKEEKPLVMSWLGFGFILMATAVAAVHHLATDPDNISLANFTRVAYITFLVSLFWSFMYLGFIAIRSKWEEVMGSAFRWLK